MTLPHPCFTFPLLRTVSLLSLVSLFAAQSSFAQFSPGPNPITGTVGSQTLSAGTGTVNASGTISAGSSVGVTMTGTSTLNNSGMIVTTSGRSIDSNSGTANLTVTNSGTIQSTSSDAFRVNTANSSVNLTNSGTIQVTAGGQAIDWASITTGSNTLTNQTTGVISAIGEDAIRPGQNGVIYNYGTISATPTGTTSPSGSDGIDLRTQKTVTVHNSGTITGRHGIATDGANIGPSSLTVHNNAGTISALNGSGLNVDGVNTSVTANVTNANGATIKGGVLAAATDGDGDGIDIDGILTLNNSGDILGLGAKGGTGTGNNAEGIAAGGGSITNTTTGRIIGSTLLAEAPNGNSARAGNGILIDDSNGGNAVAVTTVTNSGLIQGKSGFGIKIVGTFNDTITNNSVGTIRGIGAGATIQTGDGADTLTNSGTIIHDNLNTAVSLEGGNDTLNHNAGTIYGAIDGGTGTNTLNLGAGVLHSQDTKNFQNVNVATGTATLGGNVSGTSLTKGGNGTLALTAANTYTGTTTVSSGKLVVNNSTGSATGNGAVVVNTGAVLGGSGTLSGILTVDGIIAPGNSIGTLTTGDDVVWNGNAANQWAFELGAANTSDQLEIGGGFLKGTGSNYTFNFLDTGSAGLFVLVDWSGNTTFLASDFAYSNLGDGLSGTFALNGSQLELTVIPEPSTTAILMGAGAIGIALMRRRRSQAG